MTPEEIIGYVDLTDKESIVDLLFAVQAGTISCRKAAGVLCEAHEIPIPRLDRSEEDKIQLAE